MGFFVGALIGGTVLATVLSIHLLGSGNYNIIFIDYNVLFKTISKVSCFSEK
jgi:hypothetical protein